MSNSVDSIDNEETEEECVTSVPLTLSLSATLCYGVGHFYNDLCACIWFTYLMLFLQKVLKFRSWRAGLLMLIGQTTDAICLYPIGWFRI